jgi:hypothetical protein
MLTETITARSGRHGLCAPGAFPHVRGDVRLEGSTGPRMTVTGTPGTGIPAAGAVFSAAAPVNSARKRVNPAWLLAKAPFSQAHVQKTVRTHNIYMTRVLANGGDAMGPHRRRVPV